MRTPSEVEVRLREILVDELRRRLAREVLPHLCTHNHRQPLDHRKTVYDEANPSYNRISAGQDDSGVSLPVLQTIGLCLLGSENPETWPVNICEEPIDAQRCPYFDYKESRAEVYERFVADLRNPEWVEASLPEASLLLWVLGASLSLPNGSSGLERLWAWFRRILTGSPESEKSVSVAVYLPALDAFPDENRPRAAADH